jgi:hypothetical protein
LYQKQVKELEMVYLAIEFWEVVLDVIGLCLCGITIIYLIRNKARFKKVVLKKRDDDNFSMFDKALIFQLLKQQSEKSFETIFNTLKNENQALQESSDTPLEEAQNQAISNIKKENRDDKDQEEPADLYGEVTRLKDLGVSAKEISERVSLPKAEIDLIINLKRRGYESAA